MNNLISCKQVLVRLCYDEAQRKNVQLQFDDVEVMDDGQRLMIKEGDDIVHAFNMKYVLYYQVELDLEEE